MASDDAGGEGVGRDQITVALNIILRHLEIMLMWGYSVQGNIVER